MKKNFTTLKANIKSILENPSLKLRDTLSLTNRISMKIIQIIDHTNVKYTDHLQKSFRKFL